MCMWKPEGLCVEKRVMLMLTLTLMLMSTSAA